MMLKLSKKPILLIVKSFSIGPSSFIIAILFEEVDSPELYLKVFVSSSFDKKSIKKTKIIIKIVIDDKKAKILIKVLKKRPIFLKNHNILIRTLKN